MINTDESGFLIGERRLKELNKGMSDVHGDTSQILKILQDLIGQNEAQRLASNNLVGGIKTAVQDMAKAKSSVNVTLNTGNGKVTRSTGQDITINTGSSSTTATSERTRSTIGRSTQNIGSNQAGVDSKPQSERLRDSRGRFIGNSSDDSNTIETASTGTGTGRDSRGRFIGNGSATNNEKGLLESIKSGINASSINPDLQGIDPTLDAMREVGSILSPAKKAFTYMGRGSLWLYRKGKPKHLEKLPQAQQDHNVEVERHNFEQRKLLKKLIDAVRSGNGSLLSKLFGGLKALLTGALLKSLLDGGNDKGRNGRNGRNAPPVPLPNNGRDRNNPPPLPAPNPNNPNNPNQGNGGGWGKKLGKIPLIGAVLGGAWLASGWDDKDNGERGADIGAMVGTGVGGFLGSFATPVAGTVAGGLAGGVVGEQVGRKIGEWTNSLQAQDIGGKILDKWDKAVDGMSQFFGFGGGISKVGFGGFGGFGGGRIMTASYGRGSSSGGYGGGYSGGSSSGGYGAPSSSYSTGEVYNPKGEIPIVKVLETGNGYNVVELADGSVIKQTGDWNWRNRNAGNLEDTDFIAKRGSLNQKDAKTVITNPSASHPKRFATFPTFEAGRLAKEKLLFEGKYRNMRVSEIASDYAPKKENNTALYSRRLVQAVGSDKRLNELNPQERKLLMDQIHANEGKSNKGKIEVIRPPTKKYDPSQPTVPAQNGNAPTVPTIKQAPKQIFVNSASKSQPKEMMALNGGHKVRPIKAPDMPKVVRRENTPQQQPQLFAQSNQDQISQNPNDRDIAHALTGGLGMRSLIV